MAKQVGQTKDAGWELGLRRTVDAAPDVVWAHLTGPGLVTWLGTVKLPNVPKQRYETAEGTRGELRSFTRGERIRLTWQPADSDHESTLQVTLRPAGRGTTFGFHQERLSGPEERKELLTHWHRVADALVDALV